MKCPICTLPIKRGHKTTGMADGSRCHEICFDIVCTGLAADISIVVGPDEVVEFDGEKFHTL